MNFKARIRLFMSRFKMSKPYYLQLEKIFEKLEHGVYVFNDDGLIIATSNRVNLEQGIRATASGNSIAEQYPRGVAVTEDGVRLVEGKVSEDFLNVMKTIAAFNKEFYIASRNSQTRRNNSNWGQHRDHSGSDKRKPSSDRSRGTERSFGVKKGA